jgi:hypothetical protein
MNEHDPFEQRLRRQSPQQVPSAWRGEILAQARAAAEANRQSATDETATEERAAWLAGWRLVFGRLPLAWASLAALWIALVGVNLMLPSPLVSVPSPATASAQMESLTALELQSGGTDSLDQELSPAAQPLPTSESPVRLHRRGEGSRELWFGRSSRERIAIAFNRPAVGFHGEPLSFSELELELT